MNKLLLFLAVLVSPFTANAQLAVEYRFEATCNNTACADNCYGTGTPNPFYVNPAILVSASPCNLGAGVNPGATICGSSAMNGFAAGQPGNPNRARWAHDWPVGFSATDYFGISLVAQPTTIVFIDSVKWRERRSDTGPHSRELGTSSNNFASPIWMGIGGAADTWISQKVTSGLPSFTSAAPLGIRIYGFSASNVAGSLRIDSLRVYAHAFSTLPVELLSFTGKAVDEDVQLKWTTGSELDNDHFEIMRSDNGQAWSEIGRVPGSGTTTIPRNYSFTDSCPILGTNYYKLRQVDVDGESEDSHTISVDVDEGEWFRRAGDMILSDKPTMLFDALGQLISGPSHEHRMDRAGMLILRQEDPTRSTRFVR